MLLLFFNDSDPTFRWDFSGLMHEFGDERVVEVLIDRLKNGPDPQIRGTAAYALGIDNRCFGESVTKEFAGKEFK